MVTRSRLRKSFAAGQVRAGDRSVKPGWVVEAPVTVELALPELAVIVAVPEPIPLHVVLEDAQLLVVDKPAGMVVHPSVGHERGTLVAAVLHHLGVDADALPVLPGNDASRPGIVHRLDKDTSGLLVIAKTPAAQSQLAAQFEAHTIDRRYAGIVRGVPSFERRTLDTTHARDPSDRRRFAPGASGRRAVTHVEVVEPLHEAALIGCALETGRTHQIRMHARFIGHPIFGDDLYGARPPAGPRRELWVALGRHALHAERLGFDHPAGGRIDLTSALPRELATLLDRLR